MTTADRRRFLKLSLQAAILGLIRPQRGVAAQTQVSDSKVVWGGSGFNVPFDEIVFRLGRVNQSLEADNGIGWKNWIDTLYSALAQGFNGVVETGPDIEIEFSSDPGPIFSVGFDYENFLRIDIEPGEVPDDPSNGADDLAFYWLFSSIRIYTIRIPRQGSGLISLVYSKPVRSFNRSLLRTGERSENAFVIETLLSSESFSLSTKFNQTVAKIGFEESFFEPKHIRIRSVQISTKALDLFTTLGLEKVFNSNFFASVFGVAINQSFEASVLPFVMTDYLGRTLAKRFDQELDVDQIFKDMDSDIASYYVEIDIKGGLRKIVGETAGQQLISRGLAMEARFIDAGTGQEIFKARLLKAERREQVLGRKNETWYRSNDSLYFCLLVEKMVNDFFEGLKTENFDLLAGVGIKAKDMNQETLKRIKKVLDSCRYGA